MNRPLGKKAQTIAIPPQQSYDVASAAEDKDVSGEWLLKKHGLHLRTQTIETSAHVGDAGGPYNEQSTQLISAPTSHGATTSGHAGATYDNATLQEVADLRCIQSNPSIAGPYGASVESWPLTIVIWK